MSDNEERKEEQARIVEGEVVGGVPPQASRRPPGGPATGASFFHPLSGVIILGVDWLAFGLNLFSGYGALALISLACFAATFYGVLWVQRQLRGDAAGAALFKALLGGLAAGVPFPIAGTVLGAIIIALSGLPAPRRKG